MSNSKHNLLHLVKILLSPIALVWFACVIMPAMALEAILQEFGFKLSLEFTAAPLMWWSDLP